MFEDMDFSVETGKQAALLALSLYTVNMLRRWLSGRSRASTLQGLADKRRTERDAQRADVKAKIPSFADIPDGLEIIQMTATDMAEAISSGKHTSEKIVTTICARSIQAGEELNATTEERYLEAISEAKERDAEQAAGKMRGPLHGVPFSVKDQVNMAGFDSANGCAAKLFQPRTEDSPLVTILRDAGAIPFARSNLPQCGMLAETANHIYGTTSNPYDKTRTSGGSSGGEGVLVSTGASPLGIGSDIGGSIRIPSSFCGIVGFKPTPMRMTQVGMTQCKKADEEGPQGQYAIQLSTGPMARSVKDCALTMQLWCERQTEFDPLLAKQPWDNAAVHNERKLRFGVLRYDGVFPVCSAVRRAMDVAVEGLRRDGHEIVELECDCTWNYVAYVKLLMTADGDLDSVISCNDGETLHPYYQLAYASCMLPNFLRNGIATVLGLVGMKRMKILLEDGGALSARQYVAAIATRDRHRAAFMAMLKEKNVDAVLCSQAGLPALKHGDGSNLAPIFGYTMLWNNMHFPAGSVPVTNVQQGEECYTQVEQKFSDPVVKDAERNMKNSLGLPVGVQVATLPYTDELCLKAMRDVEKAVQGQYKKPQMQANTATMKSG